MSLSKFTKECQIGMKWRIKEDYLKRTLTELENKVRTNAESDVFKASNIPGVKYSLCLKLNMDDPNSAYIFLWLDYNIIAKITANYTISVKSATYKKHFYKIFDKSYGYGCKIFTRNDVFDREKKFFVNGYMEIEMEGTIKLQGGIKRKATEPLSLGRLLWEKDDKDVTIVVKDEQIKVHKWIICQKSPVFKAELESGLKESLENKIIITDFRFETVEVAMKYLYEHDIKDLVNEDNGSELLHFSDKYNIEPLHNLSQTLLIEKLSATNVCKFANMSITSNAKDLRECCICFLMNLNGQSTIIENFSNLNSDIKTEIGSRSFLSTSVSE